MASIISTIKTALTAEGTGLAKGRAMELLAEYAGTKGMQATSQLVQATAPNVGASQGKVVQLLDDLHNLAGFMADKAKEVSHPRRWDLL